jgi:hypothetical protein
MLPVKVLAAVRTNVPAPDLVNPPAPDITEPTVAVSPESGLNTYELAVKNVPVTLPCVTVNVATVSPLVSNKDKSPPSTVTFAVSAITVPIVPSASFKTNVPAETV